MRCALARPLESAGPKKDLKGKEPLSEPLRKGAEVPLSGNALFTFKLLTGGLLTGSSPKPVGKPADSEKTKERAAVGTDVSEFEDRVMW